MPRMSTLPNLTITIGMSDGFYQLVSGDRLWNIYARAALAHQLIKHHETRIPKHFRLGARGTYQYHRRRKSTERKKVKYWRKPPNLDLVRSGQTSLAVMRKRTITFAGSFGGPKGAGTLQGRLNMFLPYPLRRNDKVGGISPEDIAAEITSTTDQEAQEIAEGYRDDLAHQINSYHGPMRVQRPGGGVNGLVNALMGR